MLLRLIENFLKKRSAAKTDQNSGPQKQGNRENLQRNFLRKDDPNKKHNDFIDRKNQSMQDSQGVSDFSGSSYNGPGNVDREKTNSNMSQRNFEN